jgi:hypothetical protein
MCVCVSPTLTVKEHCILPKNCVYIYMILRINSDHFREHDLPTKLNSVAYSPQANYTERPPLVGEGSANFCG